MSPCHSSATKLRQLAPFVHLSKRELRRLGQLCATISFASDKVLAQQGHLCQEFVILVEGTAREIGDDGHELGVLEAGQHFGEVAIVRGIPNPSTIVASTPVTLEVMSTREFLSAYRTMPALRKHIDTFINQVNPGWPHTRPYPPPDPDGPDLGPTEQDPYTLAS